MPLPPTPTPEPVLPWDCRSGARQRGWRLVIRRQGMGLPGVLSTRPHRLVFLAAGDACLYAGTLKYGDPVENWSPEMQYVYAAFAWMTVW